jgi:hypothetical protein
MRQNHSANASEHSNTLSVLILPDDPLATAATDITNSGFTAFKGK